LPPHPAAQNQMTKRNQTIPQLSFIVTLSLKGRFTQNALYSGSAKLHIRPAVSKRPRIEIAFPAPKTIASLFKETNTGA
jgi:hypothetical protein